jgi:glycosyltransferase involved in cell wall biosynthesis
MTFRRPEMLRQTLLSLVHQVGAPAFAVVVVENDAATQAGAEIATEIFQKRRLRGVCIVEPTEGNCRAANRAFGEARRQYPAAAYILMLDDDEIADPHWLGRMVAAARAEDVDIVGGPVLPRFPAGAPPRLAAHPIYWPAYRKSGRVPMIYGSGNFLIRRRAHAALANPNFDLRYNYLGGGDTEFFTRCRRAGLTFYWAQEARIDEVVPPERLRSGWIIRRGLRIGAINYHVERSASASWLGRLRPNAKSAAIIPIAIFRSARLALAGRAGLVAIHPIIVACGRILAAFGIEPEQYRNSAETKNP